MPSAEEIWQAYSKQGLPTEGITKTKARAGQLHGSAHVWITKLRDGHVEVLLQKRAKDKPTWPGMWDISAAGHIDYQETPLEAAVRETQEEVGITIRQDGIRLLFMRHDVLKFDDVIENEFRWVYCYSLKPDETATIDNNEVESTRWASLHELDGLIQSSELVPQGKAYFDDLLNYLKNEDH